MEKAISEKDLNIQIKILAKKINDEHRDDPTPVVMVCVLNGGFMFFSDLVKAITIPIEIDFIRCKSYYSRKQGDLVISKDLETFSYRSDKTCLLVVEDSFSNSLFKRFSRVCFSIKFMCPALLTVLLIKTGLLFVIFFIFFSLLLINLTGPSYHTLY